jgi:hypothetical protein
MLDVMERFFSARYQSGTDIPGARMAVAAE